MCDYADTFQKEAALEALHRHEFLHQLRFELIQYAWSVIPLGVLLHFAEQLKNLKSAKSCS